MEEMNGTSAKLTGRANCAAGQTSKQQEVLPLASGTLYPGARSEFPGKFVR